MRLSVDQTQLVAFGKTLKTLEDGALLRRDLIRTLKVAVEPAVGAVGSKLSAIPHHGAATPSPGLGEALAGKAMVSVRLSGSSAGVRVRIPKTPKLRGFAMAAKRLNRAKWRHPVFGHDRWVDQESPIPGYFDDTLRAGKPEYRAAVLLALAQFKKRIRI